MYKATAKYNLNKGPELCNPVLRQCFSTSKSPQTYFKDRLRTSHQNEEVFKHVSLVRIKKHGSVMVPYHKHGEVNGIWNSTNGSPKPVSVSLSHPSKELSASCILNGITAVCQGRHSRSRFRTKSEPLKPKPSPIFIISSMRRSIL